MAIRILFGAILCLVSAVAASQTDTGNATDVAAIHQLIDQYTKAVGSLDTKLTQPLRYTNNLTGTKDRAGQDHTSLSH